MSMSTAAELNDVAVGQYTRPKPTDIRSPCPLLNALANHGYLPRDGRSFHQAELSAALKKVGLSPTLRLVLSNPVFLEHQTAAGSQQQRPASSWSKLWYLMRNPWAIFFSFFGMRRPGQQDDSGEPVLDLDQIGLPGVAEHDISLTRRDVAQGDHLKAQPDLVEGLLASSPDGGKTMRKRRMDAQKQDNPGLLYGPLQHRISCAEIALVLCVFGDDTKVPWEYVRALFAEERLPTKEGWKSRRWWRSLGLMELSRTSNRVAQLIGVKVE